MKGLKVVCGMLALCISMPIGIYLQYRILTAVEATAVMWLLFWAGMPVSIFVSIAYKVAELVEDKP